MKNPMIILVGPSGSGKSSLVARLTQEFPQLKDTVTCTTRPKRAGETDGNPYYFLSPEIFEQKIQEDFFVEWAKVHSNFYGTPKHQIHEAWDKGLTIIMDVDIQGARAFKQKYPQALTVFILPPSIDELRRRIIARDGLRSKDLDLRIRNAQKEIHAAPEFDYQIMNDDFDLAYSRLKKIIEENLQSR